MLIDAILLIQDVQLLCFTIIFGFVALQRKDDPTPRWLFYSFLANAVGAMLDFSGTHIPLWIGRGVSLEMIPISYMLINVAVIKFMGRFARTAWISVAILVGTLPFLLLWSGNPVHFPSDALQDTTIAMQVLATGVILLWSSETATQYPRVLMSVFLLPFAGIEFTRGFVALVMHQNPDVFSRKLELVSSVSYIVSTSVLPLAFIWMMNARLEAELKRETVLDPLTQVLNRRGLQQALDREFTRYLRYKHSISVALVDLDHFKRLNDTYGHVAGDAVLMSVGMMLSKLVRKTDVVARLGGEEFVVILPHTDDVAAKILLERVREALEAHLGTASGVGIPVTASFGFTATRKRLRVEPTELMREADMALYRAKESGRNRVACFTSEDTGYVPKERRL